MPVANKECSNAHTICARLHCMRFKNLHSQAPFVIAAGGAPYVVASHACMNGYAMCCADESSIYMQVKHMHVRYILRTASGLCFHMQHTVHACDNALTVPTNECVVNIRMYFMTIVI